MLKRPRLGVCINYKTLKRPRLALCNAYEPLKRPRLALCNGYKALFPQNYDCKNNELISIDSIRRKKIAGKHDIFSYFNPFST